MMGLPQKGLIFLRGILLLPLRAGIRAMLFGALVCEVSVFSAVFEVICGAVVRKG